MQLGKGLFKTLYKPGLGFIQAYLYLFVKYPEFQLRCLGMQPNDGLTGVKLVSKYILYTAVTRLIVIRKNFD